MQRSSCKKPIQAGKMFVVPDLKFSTLTCVHTSKFYWNLIKSHEKNLIYVERYYNSYTFGLYVVS